MIKENLLAEIDTLIDDIKEYLKNIPPDLNITLENIRFYIWSLPDQTGKP